MSQYSPLVGYGANFGNVVGSNCALVKRPIEFFRVFLLSPETSPRRPRPPDQIWEPWRPANLYDTVTELRQSIDSRGFRDTLVDATIERVKPECLQAAEEVADSG